MIERIRQKAFFKNNGMVLKAVNLLRDKFVALTDIRYALEPSMTEAEFRDSINYLTESRIYPAAAHGFQGVYDTGRHGNGTDGSQGDSGRHQDHCLCPQDECIDV